MAALIAYLATFVSSVCFGLGSVLEQVGTRRVSQLESRNLASFLPLFRQLPYVAGLALDGLGFAAFIVAAHALPLFFVQAMDTGSVLTTAIASRYILGVRVRRKEYQLMAALVAGLLLLAYATPTETAGAVSDVFRYSLLVALAPVVVVSFIVSKRI